MELASVFREKEESLSKTTLNKNFIFGSMSTNYIDNLFLSYKFALDNNLDEIEYNDINASLSLNNFVTTFNFIKETNEMGDENFIKILLFINLMIKIKLLSTQEEIEN